MTSIFANFTDPTVPNGPTLYKMATKPLPFSFDGSRSKHSVFLSQLRDKINECGWNPIITFNDKNLIDNSDSISMTDVKTVKAGRDLIILTGPRQAAENVTAITDEKLLKPKEITSDPNCCTLFYPIQSLVPWKLTLLG